MRVLVRELDTARAKGAEQARRLALWLGQMQREVGGADGV